MMFWYVVGWLYAALTWGFLGAGIGRPRKLEDKGFLMGFFCGPLGVAWVFSRPVPAQDPEPGVAFPDGRIRRPHDVDRAGPFVPHEHGQADSARWAEQMRALAAEESKRRKDGGS